ncbi:hypothetical protein HPB49_000111 [Dermacentor silvarum]|uniref:Uncharacterized protein n=1 Tax=Dermacentor silvarum TaxID=543639 RepID=A0ACB8C6G7_DERSI|nr:hypothetical protein HPB49_000111 [Dermacentor silvarum]
MEFEDVLEKLGGYGKFQKMLVWGYLAPASILMPGYFMSQIFMLSTPKHTCQLPDFVRASYNLTASEALVLGAALVSEDNCRVFPPTALNSSLVNQILNGPNAANGSSWLATSDIEWEPCERIGRRFTFFITVVVATVFGISSILVTNFIAFIVLRFINATIMPQIFQIPYVILLELVGTKQRTAMLAVGWMSWTAGLCLLPLAAFLTRDWTVLGPHVLCSSGAQRCLLEQPPPDYQSQVDDLQHFRSTFRKVLLLFVRPLKAFTLLPESPRWLLSRDRFSEATRVLTRVAKTNGVCPPKSLANDLERVQRKLAEEEKVAKSSTADLMRMPKVRSNFLIITLSWVANAGAYYGMSINVTNMSGNEFVNFFLLALVEFPACVIAWWAMEKLGRRWMNVFFQFMVSASCIAFCLVPKEALVTGIVLVMLAKFSCTASAMVMYQQASEVMPTPVRSFALGASSSVASTITICMPYIIYLEAQGPTPYSR